MPLPNTFRKFLLPLLCLALLAGAGVYALLRHNAVPPSAASDKKSLVFYTATAATTPQIPFWAAVNAGWPKDRSLDVQYWKSLDDLRGVILAGKGDIWLGHLEGFAQAASRGAPITLIAVTGWKKFYFLSTDPDVSNLDSLAQTLAAKSERLGVAPPDSPALAVLEEMVRRGGPAFSVARAAPQQLALDLMRGTERHALLPEPLVTILMGKNPKLRLVAGLEEEFARRYGGPARLPLVGIAVRTSLLKEDPALVRELVTAMQAASARLQGDPKAAVAALPGSIVQELGADVLERSMARDMVLAEPAWAVREEIVNFLRMAAPEFAPSGKNPPPAFFLEPIQ